MVNEEAKPARAGLSLYANLLKPDSNGGLGTISSAPIVYNQAQGREAPQEQPVADKSQLSSAAFRLQPTKRPQLPVQKVRPKVTAQRTQNIVASTKTAPVIKDEGAGQNGLVSRMPSKSLADWTADGDDDDVNGYYAGEKRQRGGRKKRKKTKQEIEVIQNWDDIYDPSRPNVFEDYKNSDEKVLEIQEWKERLYAHRHVRRPVVESDSESDAARPIFDQRFAPPPQFSTIPLNKPEDALISESPPPPPPPLLPPSADIADLASGQGAYLRRPRPLYQIQPLLPDFPAAVELDIPPPPPPPSDTVQIPFDMPQAAPPPPPPVSNTAARISREPVRYNLPLAPPELPASEAELAQALQDENDGAVASSTDFIDARSARPGQKGFAERLMSKYGWTKGSGLGASGSGITAPLRVQLEKQKKKSDAEGGGYATPGGMGKIIGGKRKGVADAQDSRFGPMSEVVVLRGMLDGMDIDREIGSDDGGIMQEIGEECGEKYGRVERVFIDRADPTAATVFVKFTAELSALRAVNALEGRVFNGNTITARFFDSQQFQAYK